MKELRKVMIKTLIAVWALSGGSLSLILTGHVTNVPLVKCVFTILESFDGHGAETFFLLVGIGCLFYWVKECARPIWINLLSAFYALCTIIGISYFKTGSWDCIFLCGTQIVAACFVFLGYYFLYQHFILLLFHIYEKKREWFRVEARSKIENILFEKHPFLGPAIFAFVMGLPWLIAFYPGTLQWDAHAQLWMAMGVIEQTSYHPVFISNYMAACVLFGRSVFGSDSIGLFLYTMPQFILQCCVFSYAVFVMRKLRTPIFMRWMALFFWTIFPYFQIWGYTMVKDTYYYISFVLLVVVFVDVLSDKNGVVCLGQYALLAMATVGMVFSRNDGRYVILITAVWAVLCYRKYWKLCLIMVTACALFIGVEEKVYMPMQQIGKGPVGEMLSVPLQQTARYLRDHFFEVTEEEAEVLEALFDVELEEIAQSYNPEISDPVKSHLVKKMNREQLFSYFKVWGNQFLKHPDTYIQAYLNHVYRYFYPGCPNYGNYLIFSYIGNSDHWQDGYLDIQFGISNTYARDFLRHLVYTTERMPVFSALYSCGLYTFLLIGAGVYLFVHKKKREMLVLVPEACVLLICLVSPVNGFLRYMMPIMAALPVWGAWCFYNRQNEDRLESIETDEKV